MPTANIQVAYVNQPAPGKKTGSIKTTEGQFFNVYPKDLGLFQANQSYEIEFSSRDWNGKTYYDFVKMAANGAAPPQPRPGGGGGGASLTTPYRLTHPTDAERMFVCGALNAAIQGAQIDLTSPSSIGQAVVTLRAAWSATLGSDAG